MPQVFVLLGSNIGNREFNITNALNLLVKNNIQLLQVSHYFETEAWGTENQASFFNVCAEVFTELSPKKFLHLLKSFEKQMGRTPTERWGERSIDIDILYYGDVIIAEKELIIPHPQLIKRNFALDALYDIAPTFVHPQLQLNTSQLIQLCIDNKEVTRLDFKPEIK